MDGMDVGQRERLLTEEIDECLKLLAHPK